MLLDPMPMIEFSRNKVGKVQILTDLNLRIVNQNALVGSFLGTGEHLPGETLWNYLPFFDAVTLEQAKDICVFSGKSYNLPVPGGVHQHTRWQSWEVSAIFDDAGMPEGLLWSGIETSASQEQEDFLFRQAILENITEALVTLDPEMKVLSFNKVAEEIYELKAQEVIGCRLTDFFSFSILEETKESALARLHLTGEWKGTLRFENEAGRVLYVECRCVVVKDSKGIVLGYVAIDRDITEQYLLQQQHKEQLVINTLLQSVMDQTDALVFALDTDGNLKYSNAAMSRTFGWDQSALNKNLWQLFPPDECRRFELQNQSLLESGGVSNFIQEVNTPSGKVKYKTTKFPVTIGNEKMVAGIALDLTTELSRESELANLKNRYEVAAKLTADLIGDWDIPADKIWRNDPETHILVHREKAKCMADRYNRLHPEDLPAFRNSLEAALASEATRWEQEYRYATGHKQGDYKICYEKAFIQRDGNGKAIRMISVLQDITEKRRLQMELREKEKKVMAATIQGQEAERKEIALELHDNVGQILAVCKLFMDMYPKISRYKHLQLCRENLLLAIDEIRQLSHRLNPVSFEGKSLAGVIAELVEKVNDTQTIHLKLDVAEQLFTAELPGPVRITAYRIIQEMIGNILKHAEATEGVITMSIATAQLLIEVKDNGKGFVVGSKKAGIGLQNIKSRVDAVDGKFMLSSTPGNGCIIAVEIPL